jgi:hypothetical protein
MKSSDAIQKWCVSTADSNGKAYFPFNDNEIVQSIHLKERSTLSVFTVEDACGDPVASGSSITNLKLGFVRTKCLMIETNPNVEVKVLIIK